MVGRLVAGMAGNAVRCPSSLVVEASACPGFRTVTGRTLPAGMVGGLAAVMAGSAVRCSSRLVIEACPFPGRSAVAG